MFNSELLGEWRESDLKSMYEMVRYHAHKKNGCTVCYTVLKAIENGGKPSELLPQLVDALVLSKEAYFDQAKLGREMRPIMIPMLRDAE